MERILCPIKNTQSDAVVMNYAIALARERNTELVFFHATAIPFSVWKNPLVENPLLIPGGFSWGFANWIEGERTRTRRFIAMNYGAQLNGLRWRAEVEIGKPTREIVDIAYREEARLIVMTRGEKLWPLSLISGVKAEQVSRMAPCPVVTVLPHQIANSWAGRSFSVALR